VYNIDKDIQPIQEALWEAYENPHRDDLIDAAIKLIRDLEWKYQTSLLRGYTGRALRYLEKAKSYKRMSNREEWIHRAYDYLPDRLEMPIRKALEEL